LGLRGLTWDSNTPGEDDSLGVLRVLRSVWRGRVERLKLARIGEVAVKDVKFDPTKRPALDASILGGLMSNG